MHVPGLPDLSVVQEAGATFGGVQWVTVPDPLATTESVRAQGYSKPITGGYKLEGAWWGSADRCAYFVSSFARTQLGPSRGPRRAGVEVRPGCRDAAARGSSSPGRRPALTTPCTTPPTTSPCRRTAG
jgi:hypothetical protein